MAKLLSSEEDAAIIAHEKKCSGAFAAGQWASLALGGGRLAYAGSAKLLSLSLRGGGMGAARAAVYGRNALKVGFRGGLWWGGMMRWGQAVERYGTAESIIEAAGRTNQALNKLGAGAAAWGGVGGAASQVTKGGAGSGGPC